MLVALEEESVCPGPDKLPLPGDPGAEVRRTRSPITHPLGPSPSYFLCLHHGNIYSFPRPHHGLQHSLITGGGRALAGPALWGPVERREG